jgi:hypothetical protein
MSYIDTRTLSRKALVQFLRTGQHPESMSLAQKYNHNHDPQNGQFTDVSGGAGGSVDNDVAQPRYNPILLPHRLPLDSRATIASARRLGDLSMAHETGKYPHQYREAAGVVSTGYGDKGGKSYGAYQLASKTGTLQAFLQQEGARWAPELDGEDPTQPGSFGETWKAIARREPELFFQAQHDFIKRSHYDPVVQFTRTETGVDINARSLAVQDVIWSMSVQHGKAKHLVTGAIKVIQKLGKIDDNAALINGLYDMREIYVRKQGLAKLIPRYRSERRDALNYQSKSHNEICKSVQTNFDIMRSYGSQYKPCKNIRYPKSVH